MKSTLWKRRDYREYQFPFFLSVDSKTQPNHWTKRMVSTHIATWDPRNRARPEDQGRLEFRADTMESPAIPLQKTNPESPSLFPNCNQIHLIYVIIPNCKIFPTTQDARNRTLAVHEFFGQKKIQKASSRTAKTYLRTVRGRFIGT